MFKTGMILLIIYTIIYNIVIACQGDYYGTYSTYNDLCFKRNIFAWLPPLSILVIGLGILIFYKSDFRTLGSLFWLLLFSAIAGLINSFHAGHKNIDTGYQMDMVNTKRFNKEENDMEAGKAAVIAGSIYAAHHIKKNIKEIEDVDNWKQFK